MATASLWLWRSNAPSVQWKAELVDYRWQVMNVGRTKARQVTICMGSAGSPSASDYVRTVAFVDRGAAVAVYDAPPYDPPDDVALVVTWRGWLPITRSWTRLIA